MNSYSRPSIKKPRVMCGDCQYLRLTYEPRHPWSCSRFGFKSREIPARLVLNETGMECAYYSSRMRKMQNI
ncbi:MAG TPA: hypothetical protein DHC76_12790 [Rhodobacteraceae bacterium]|nr:hypothetical protein [Paracoccaceae bacterium]